MSDLASLAGEVLWTPGEDEWRNSNLADYMRWLPKNGRPAFTAYQDLWRALHEMPENRELADCFFIVMQRLGTQLAVPTTSTPRTKGRATHA